MITLGLPWHLGDKRSACQYWKWVLILDPERPWRKWNGNPLSVFSWKSHSSQHFVTYLSLLLFQYPSYDGTDSWNLHVTPDPDSINIIVLRWDSSSSLTSSLKRVFLGGHTALYFLQVGLSVDKGSMIYYSVWYYVFQNRYVLDIPIPKRRP